MLIRNCDLCLRKNSSSRFWRADRKGVLSGKCACLHTQNIQPSKQEHNVLYSNKASAESMLVCTTQKQTLSECEDLPNNCQRRGETVSGSSLFAVSSAKSLGPCLRTIKGEPSLNHGDSPSLLTNQVLPTVISITTAVHSGRLLTTPCD